MAAPILIAKNPKADLVLLPALANRHGLIAGATGTGKTVTLQTLAQGFSAIGVPVFMADVKGDLAGLALAGGPNSAGGGNPKVAERAKSLKIDIAFAACPVTFWDVFGKSGHPVRATVSDMGPLLLARMLNLNDTQEGVLNLVFRIADDRKLPLLDAKDLRAMLQYVGDKASDFTTEYGNVSTTSIGAIQRGLLSLESQGADSFFGERMLDIKDLMQVRDGKGVVNILAAEKLMNSPKLYGTFLLWMLAELFEHLPELGDPEKPVLVFFFDEAHLLFNEAPKALLDKIEQMVRLIRSKGVGVYFVTQNPLDIPDTVLGQLGNRVQHALRAFTPRDQKAVKSAAETMRPNPKLKVERIITELAVGEALISFLDEKGRPNVVERAFVVPPGSQLGPISESERLRLIEGSSLCQKYQEVIDKESAFEMLHVGLEVPPTKEKDSGEQPAQSTMDKASNALKALLDSPLARNIQRAIGSQIGREIGQRIIRGILSSITRLDGGTNPKEGMPPVSKRYRSPVSMTSKRR